MNHKFIIADHVRASIFLISDGVKPSGKQQGYILRRLMRRSLASSLALKIDITNPDYFKDMIGAVVAAYSESYPELQEVAEFALILFNQESQKYNRAIATGEKQWGKAYTKNSEIGGEDLAALTFDMYQTHGVPIELSLDIVKQKGGKLDQEVLHKLIEEHQQKSQDVSKKQFKGGLAEQNEQTTRMHTVTHILHHQLRSMFGEDIKQMGSKISTEKARFDFSFDRRLEEEEIVELTTKIQEVIDLGLTVSKQEMSPHQARELGAIGLFGEKYGDKVMVYTIQDKEGQVFSREFCGGPHVVNTSEIGKFSILKQKSVGQGVKRIEFTVI